MGTEHTYAVNYKLTDGTEGAAGKFTVKDGEDGAGVYGLKFSVTEAGLLHVEKTEEES